MYISQSAARFNFWTAASPCYSENWIDIRALLSRRTSSLDFFPFSSPTTKAPTKNDPPRVRESKTVLDSGFQAVDSGFQVLDSSLWQWSLDSGFQLLVNFGFLELYSKFQNPGFLILQAKFSRIPDTTSNFLECGVRIPLHGAKR